MRKANFNNESCLIELNTTYESNTLEEKIEKIVNSKEPIGDVTTPLYTERKNGVEAQYNIRTDRFDIAIEAREKITASNQARREERIKSKEVKKEVNKVESTDPTE